MRKDAEAGIEAAVKFFETAPKLEEHEVHYWDAFGALTTERPSSMGGILPIPFSAILRFAKHYGYTRTETDDLVAVIRTMDMSYVGATNAKLAKASK